MGALLMVAYSAELQHKVPLIQAPICSHALTLILCLASAVLCLQLHRSVAWLQVQAFLECCACCKGVMKRQICCAKPACHTDSICCRPRFCLPSALCQLKDMLRSLPHRLEWRAVPCMTFEHGHAPTCTALWPTLGEACWLEKRHRGLLACFPQPDELSTGWQRVPHLWVLLQSPLYTV